MRFSAGAHEDERPLGEGGVDEHCSAGEGEAEVDVMEEEKRRERPENVEGRNEGPELQKFAAGLRSAEGDSAKQEGAHGDECGGGGDEDDLQDAGPGERFEKLLDFGEVGEGSDVEGGVHELHRDEESANDGARRVGELGGRGEDGGERWFGDRRGCGGFD